MWLVGPAAARAAEVGDREGAQAAEGRAVQGASHVLRTRSRPNHYERDRRNARALLRPRPPRRVGRGQLGLLVCAIDRGFDFKVFAVGQAEGSFSSAALRSGEAPNDAP